MDFGQIGKSLLQMGLPVLGNALLGPLGGAAASVIANAIGAPPTPEGINSVIQSGDREVMLQKLRSAEAEWIAEIQSQTELGKMQMEQVGETMRAEINAALQIGGRTGRIIQFLQLSWRPLFCYQLIVEFAVLDLIVAYELLTDHHEMLNMMLQFTGFMTWYFGSKIAFAGVYAAGRSYEKGKISDGASAIAPEWIRRIIETFKK